MVGRCSTPFLLIMRVHNPVNHYSMQSRPLVHLLIFRKKMILNTKAAVVDKGIHSYSPIHVIYPDQNVKCDYSKAGYCPDTIFGEA